MTDTGPVTKQELIESRIDRSQTAAMPISQDAGGLGLNNMLQVMELAKLMAVSQQAVPPHLRNNPGMCLAVCLTAVEWKMSPFAVANKTYVTNDRLNYESQLLHAVIEARAPLKERLKVRYEGDGEDMVCVVSGTFRGEHEPREHRSPPLKSCRPPRNEYGKTKGSPLWDKKPAVQMFYDTSRDFCRIYCPDVILGIYTPDEVEQYGIGEEARDVTAADALHARLAASKRDSGEGYRDGVVDAGLNGDTGAHDASEAQPAPTQHPDETPTTGRRRRGKKASPSGSGQPPSLSSEPETPPQPEPEHPAEPAGAPTAEEPKNPEPPQVAMPRNYQEYRAWVICWVMSFDTEADLRQRWAAERKLRNDCGLVADEANDVLAIVEKRIEQVGK